MLKKPLPAFCFFFVLCGATNLLVNYSTMQFDAMHILKFIIACTVGASVATAIMLLINRKSMKVNKNGQ